MKKSAGYSINGNVVTLTKAFAKKAYTPGTKEFREFSAIIKAYPNLVVTMRTATITADKNTHEGLTIEWMTTYIKTYKDETAVAEFEEVKKFYKMMNGYLPLSWRSKMYLRITCSLTLSTVVIPCSSLHHFSNKRRVCS